MKIDGRSKGNSLLEAPTVSKQFLSQPHFFVRLQVLPVALMFVVPKGLAIGLRKELLKLIRESKDKAVKAVSCLFFSPVRRFGPRKSCGLELR